MFYVYVLKSKKTKSRFYIGMTGNLKRRLEEHSKATKDKYTYRHAPWELETYIVFKNKFLATEFESYLKTSSGRTFLKRHLIQKNE